MSVIQNQADLLCWLADQLKAMVPQATVIQGLVYNFDDLISIFNEFGRFYPDRTDWSEYLNEIFELTNRFPAAERCSPRVLAFLSRIFGESIATEEPVSRERAIAILIQMLRLEHLFRRKKGEGGQMVLISTRAFREAHGFRVRVQLTAEGTSPRRKAVADLSFFQI